MTSARIGRRALLGLVGTGFVPEKALAARRIPYGDEVTLSLPLPVSALDPHDPHDMTACLLGRGVFEPLFGQTTTNRPYPTLARSLPVLRGNALRIELREGLRFASGSKITAQDVVYSLERCRNLSSAWPMIGRVRTAGEAVEVVTPLSSLELALELSRLGSAILPRDFSPERPDASGAFRAVRKGGSLLLEHNPLAPRGGSYLNRVVLQGRSVKESLRSFEATQSDVSLLGEGLYQSRKGARALRLPPLGYAVLVPGKGFAGVTRPGELQAHLAHLPREPFSALGLTRTRARTEKWSNQPFSIAVLSDDALLWEVAQELKANLALQSSHIVVTKLSRNALRQRVAKRDFDLWLTWVTTRECTAEGLSRELFGLDGKRPPLGGRIPSPEDAARLLGLGIVGQFQPRGAYAPTLHGLVSMGRLSLESAYLLRR